MFVFSLFNTIVISFTMIGFGLLFMKKPPKEINSVFGYRTSMSSKNKDTWFFAHKYAGRVWFNSGIVTAIVSVILILTLKNSTVFKKMVVPLLIIQLIILLLVIPLAEIALRKNFDKDGKFKNEHYKAGRI